LGDLGAAQAAYERILELKANDDVSALEAVARIAVRTQQWDQAASATSRLLDLSEDDKGAIWALRLVDLEDKRGDPSAAEQALLRGLRLDPANATIRAALRQRWERAERWSELADLLVGDADLIASGHPNQGPVAEPVVTTAVRSGSLPPPPAIPQYVADEVRALRMAADIHRLRRNAPDQAAPLLERASRLVPHDRELLLALCDVYDAMHRDRDAALALEKVIASYGGRRTKDLATYHHRLGRVLVRMGDKEGALVQLDHAFRIDPGSVGILKDLGVLAFETGDLERAQKTFRALLLQRLDSVAGISKAEVFFYLGEISERLGDRPKATQMFERAIENDPSHQRARSRLAQLKG
jgi:tetratricopeptide (TPR) repeat protein